ncbi:MAG: hypothetical protein LUH23_03900 [Oscillospiraceae bacterium]|nr:hypothetical protein [Oscillospiraceae bacterium]
MWHITYFSEDDEKRIKGAMELIGCTNYELISSIDEAIKPLVMEKATVP